MSELKAFVARKIDDGTCDPVPCVEVYLKSEADKVIAHHKYKRCLTMADACRGNFLVAEHMIEKEPKNLMWHKRHKHYGRWMMLWRCFAEEFKPNSTAR